MYATNLTLLALGHAQISKTVLVFSNHCIKVMTPSLPLKESGLALVKSLYEHSLVRPVLSPWLEFVAPDPAPPVPFAPICDIAAAMAAVTTAWNIAGSNYGGGVGGGGAVLPEGLGLFLGGIVLS